jgi:hypothetical protein
MTENKAQQQDQTCSSGKQKKLRVKGKRDIFRFAGETPTAINLEHVTQLNVDGKRLNFQFYNTALYVDLEDEAAALSVFEVILGIWAGESPQ